MTPHLAIDHTTAVSRLKALPKRLGGALVRVINRSTVSGRAVIVSAIASELGLRQADIKDTPGGVRFKPATAAAPTAVLYVSGSKRLPLISFRARGPEPSRGKGRGVSYRLAGSQHGGRHPNAFIATVGASNHRGVFVRVGTARKSAGAWGKNLPIKELRGPSIGKVFERHMWPGVERIKEALRTNAEHEISRAVAGEVSGDGLEFAVTS